MDQKERDAVERDRMLFGTGIAVDGKRVDPATVTIFDTPRVTVPEAIEALKHCVENEKAHWSLTEICDPCVDVPVKYLRAAVEALSAAPAPEGGAVDYGVRTEGAPGITEPDPALATREEAPAEAGERGELLQELSDAARWRRLPGNENHLATAALFERAIAALRAQPPAREDAQPVAWQMRIMKTDGTPHGGWKYHGANAPSGHDLKSVQFRPLYTHPAPDALRVAVEALTRTRRLVAEASESGFSDPDTVRALFVNNGAITQALAALQAEQKG